jgi:acetyl esterase
MKAEKNSQSYDPTTDRGVDSHVKNFLKAVNEATPVDISEIPLEEARRIYSYATTVGDLPDLSGIDEAEKFIDEDGLRVKLHIVRPKGCTEPIPAFMYFHGGVWFLGDYETHRLILKALVVRTGMAAVFVDFTRTPDAQYPHQNNQAYAATKWIARHGKEVHIDGGRLAVAGNSIGANMATVVALMAKEKGTPHLTFQALISPVTDANFDTHSYGQYGVGRFLTRKVMQKGWELYIADPARRKEIYASPLQATTEQLRGLPPALVITEENDVLRDEGEAYARKLDEAGVWVTSTRYNGMVHDFVIINALHGLPAIQSALQQIAYGLNQFNR